ncbi:hypothetical protein CC2G_005781 [Coprinopsis cinerea AmutBmut pab1-1]|nr:hypothetical protein CC2G_005781 [Coprinopsis cinerea AmutBmut pab1-1]
MFSTGKPAPVEGHPHQWDQGIPSTSQASAKRVYGSTSSHELDPVWHTQSLTFPSKRRSSYVQGTNVPGFPVIHWALFHSSLRRHMPYTSGHLRDV